MRLNVGLHYLALAGIWPPRYSLRTEQHRFWNSSILYAVYSVFIFCQMTFWTAQTLLGIFMYETTFKEKVGDILQCASPLRIGIDLSFLGALLEWGHPINCQNNEQYLVENNHYCSLFLSLL